MSASLPEFNRGALRPVEALRGGWELVKDQYWLFMGMILVGVLIGSAVPMAILMGPMMCGIDLALLRRMRGERVTFDTLFKGFDYLGESIIATLIQVVPVLLIFLPCYVILFAIFLITFAPGRRGEALDVLPLLIFAAIFVIALMVVSLVVGAFFMFTYPLIVDRKLSGVNAVKTSIRAAWANLGGAIGLMLLTMLAGLVGVLFCYVGALLVMPITYAAWVVAYHQVFPPEVRPTVSAS